MVINHLLTGMILQVVQEPQLWLILGDLVDHNAGASISSQVSSTTEAVKEKKRGDLVAYVFFSKAKMIIYSPPKLSGDPWTRRSLLETIIFGVSISFRRCIIQHQTYATILPGGPRIQL